ncbi:MAG: hypothetical protein ABEI11_01665 [Haloarculaceae archaeon]
MTTRDETLHALPLAAADLAVGGALYAELSAALGLAIAAVGALLVGCLACQTLSRGRAALDPRSSGG